MLEFAKTFRLKMQSALLVPIVFILLPAWCEAATFSNPLSAEGTSIGATELVGRIIQGVLSIAGVLAMAYIVVGGVKLILGYAQGSEEKVGQGKKTLLYAILGLVIAFGGYVIVSAIIQRTQFLIG